MALTGTNFENIDLFPIQEKLLEELLKPYEGTTVALGTPIEPLTVQHLQEAAAIFLDQPEIQIVSQEIEPVEHSLPDDVVFEVLPDVDLTQGIDMEAELTPYTASETLDAGLIYAPYIPLQTTPTVQLSEIKEARFYTGWKSEPKFKIPKYNDIYSDIKERFEMLDL